MLAKRFIFIPAALLAFLSVSVFSIQSADAQYGSPAPAKKPAPASRPANAVLISAATAAITSGDFKTLKTKLDEQSLAAMGDLKHMDLLAVAELAAYREFAEYFSQLTALSAPQKATLTWLVNQPKLLGTLMSAVDKTDPPASVLDLLTRLHADSGDALANFPDLTTALIVVWDKPLDAQIGERSPDDSRVVPLFHYFSTAQGQRFSPATLPWQLAVYVVNLQISAPEIAWARNRYARNMQLAGAYFDVPYDTSAYLNGGKKKIDNYPFTLQNLSTIGGVCIEQAYYATQVAKTLGDPACICEGQGTGVAHAWVGILTTANGQARWDFSTGRYQEDQFWFADIRDPQTHAKLTDADVGLLAELQNSSPDQRLESSLLMRLADLVPETQLPDFYITAIQLSAGNRPAWEALADLGALGKLSKTQTDNVATVVQRNAARPYPDFACAILMKMASGFQIDQQITALNQVANMFRTRPDLVAKVRITEGDLLHAAKRDNEAVNAYGDILTNDLNAGPLIVDAMDRVAQIMQDTNQQPRLAKIYATVWPRMQMPDPSAYVSETPYYQIGSEYADLLDTLGDHVDAKSVRTRLASLQTGKAPTMNSR